MIYFNILVPFVFFFLFYLIIQIIKLTLFLIYLVQLKEYRLDRLKLHFKTISGRNQLWQYFNLLKWRRFYRPRFTFRVFLVLLFTVFIQYNLFFFTLRYSFRIFKNVPAALAFLLIFSFDIINLATPLAVLCASGISFLLLWPIKAITLSLSKAKMSTNKNLLVIGITGSYAKSSTKEILSFILSGFFKTLKTPLNCNTKFGIASLILRKLRRSHEVFVVEMGAYKKGEIAEICRLVKPKIGIITGINEQHLGLFGSLSNTQWAKFELVKSLPKNGLAIFNVRDSLVKRLYKSTKKPKMLYGQKRARVKLNLVGDWQKENFEACLLVTDYLKIPREKVYKRLAALKDIGLGLKIKKGLEASTIIDDSYSANPQGFMVALDLLKRTSARKKILVTPGIIELGKSSDKIHRQLGGKAAKICTKIFLTKPDFVVPLKQGLAKEKARALFIVEEDEVSLLNKLKPFLGKKTIVLLEGRVPSYLQKKLTKNNHD